MNDFENYIFENIKNKLDKAIAKLQKHDAVLLDDLYNINERTVTHRLAMYLTKLFPDFDVDCEYNRLEDSDDNIKRVDFVLKELKESFPKEILNKIQNGLDLEDTEARTVFPDIIIHKRKENINLLAIEVKMGWKNSKGNFDEIKAKTYKNQLGLGYKYSAYVELGPVNKTNIVWF
jgi:hypothetical protein